MLKRFLKFQIRKDAERLNKKNNHWAYTQSLSFSQKIIHLAKYHKKKIIFSILVTIIAKVYDLHKTFYYFIINLQPPHRKIYRYIYNIPKIQPTIRQQSLIGTGLPQNIIKLLINIYYQTDKRLYIGVGRKYLYDVYQQMGLLQKVDEQRNFWTATGFYKQRNQYASGVSCVQFVRLFAQGYDKLNEGQKKLTIQEFLGDFIDKLKNNFAQTKEWQIKFNEERQKQFLKNDPGQNEKKRNIILQLIKQDPKATQIQLSDKVTKMGLKGLNLFDRFQYWNSRDVYFSLQLYHLGKKIQDPTLSQRQKSQIQHKIEENQKIVLVAKNTKKVIEDSFKQLYQEQLL